MTKKETPELLGSFERSTLASEAKEKPVKRSDSKNAP